MNKPEEIQCCGCGVLLPKIEGPTHPYMLSSPACWKLYGEVLAREYSGVKYGDINRLTVDAYALQHPGVNDARAIQSVHVHLASLYLIFEKGYSCAAAGEFLDPFIKKQKLNFKYLTPPSFAEILKITDVIQAENFEAHQKIVKQWARATFDAWHQHHNYIRKFLEK